MALNTGGLPSSRWSAPARAAKATTGHLLPTEPYLARYDRDLFRQAATGKLRWPSIASWSRIFR